MRERRDNLARRNDGAGTEDDEGGNVRVGPNTHVGRIDHADGRVFADLHVAQHGVGPHGGSARDDAVALQDRARQQRHLGGHLNVGVNVGLARVPHRDASRHPLVVDARAQDPLSLGQLAPVVDPECLAGVVQLPGRGEVAHVVQHPDQVG
jgi:hypothetical protein